MLFLNLIQSAGDSFQYSPNMILASTPSPLQESVPDTFFIPKWFFPSLLRNRAVLLNRVEALDHPVPYETVQP